MNSEICLLRVHWIRKFVLVHGIAKNPSFKSLSGDKTLLTAMARAPPASSPSYSLPPSQTTFFPPDERSLINLSPLEVVLASAGIVALICSFFFAVRHPPYPSRQVADHSIGAISLGGEFTGEAEAISVVKYRREYVKDVGSECSVCLSVFADGEEIKQLNLCKHSFHATCIDMWLSNHPSCPICRATVAVKRGRGGSGAAPATGADLQHGSPVAAAMV